LAKVSSSDGVAIVRRFALYIGQRLCIKVRFLLVIFTAWSGLLFDETEVTVMLPVLTDVFLAQRKPDLFLASGRSHGT
jgi:hypothetical protein